MTGSSISRTPTRATPGSSLRFRIHKAVENEEITNTVLDVGDEYPGEHVHKIAKSPTSKGSLEMAALEVINKHPREQAPTKFKVSMPCTICPYRTTFLKKSKARKRLNNHCRRNHPLVYSTCNELGQNVTDMVARKVVQIESMETANTPTKDGPDI